MALVSRVEEAAPTRPLLSVSTLGSSRLNVHAPLVIAAGWRAEVHWLALPVVVTMVAQLTLPRGRVRRRRRGWRLGRRGRKWCWRGWGWKRREGVLSQWRGEGRRRRLGDIEGVLRDRAHVKELDSRVIGAALGHPDPIGDALGAKLSVTKAGPRGAERLRGDVDIVHLTCTARHVAMKGALSNHCPSAAQLLSPLSLPLTTR